MIKRTVNVSTHRHWRAHWLNVAFLTQEVFDVSTEQLQFMFTNAAAGLKGSYPFLDGKKGELFLGVNGNTDASKKLRTKGLAKYSRQARALVFLLRPKAP